MPRLRSCPVSAADHVGDDLAARKRGRKAVDGREESSQRRLRSAGASSNSARISAAGSAAETVEFGTPIRRSSQRNATVSTAADVTNDASRPFALDAARRVTRASAAEESHRPRHENAGRPVRHRQSVSASLDQLSDPAAARRRRAAAAAAAASLSAAASAAKDAAKAAAMEAKAAKEAARDAGREEGEAAGCAARGLEEDLACPICAELLVSAASAAKTAVTSNKCDGKSFFWFALRLHTRKLYSRWLRLPKQALLAAVE